MITIANLYGFNNEHFKKMVENSKNKKTTKRELSIQIITNCAEILDDRKEGDVLIDAKYLVARALNYTTLMYNKEKVVEFIKSREHWMQPTFENKEEAIFEIAQSTQLFLGDFLESLKSNSGFSFKNLLRIVAAIKKIEE